MPNVRIDPNSMTVSGVSAGAYAAVQVCYMPCVCVFLCVSEHGWCPPQLCVRWQLHVTFSSQFQGAGILAGGPYWCAGDNLDIALTTCMQGSVRVVYVGRDSAALSRSRAASADNNPGVRGACCNSTARRV